MPEASVEPVEAAIVGRVVRAPKLSASRGQRRVISSVTGLPLTKVNLAVTLQSSTVPLGEQRRVEVRCLANVATHVLGAVRIGDVLVMVGRLHERSYANAAGEERTERWLLATAVGVSVHQLGHDDDGESA